MVALAYLFAVLAFVALTALAFALWRSVSAALGASGPAWASELAYSEARVALLEEKASLLASLRDLRFDRDMDKLSEADFQSLDTQLRSRANGVLQALDADASTGLEEAEALVAQALAGAPEAVQAQDPVVCRACGTHNDEDASFCKRCGAKL